MTNVKLAAIKADIPPINAGVRINISVPLAPDDGQQVEFVRHSSDNSGLLLGANAAAGVPYLRASPRR